MFSCISTVPGEGVLSSLQGIPGIFKIEISAYYYERMNKKELQYQRTLDAIRKAMDEIVSSEGFDNLTIRDLCKRAGVTHGAFYNYFSSKDDLYTDRLRRLSSRFYEQYEKELKNLHSRDALKKYFDEFVLFIETRSVPMLVAVEKNLISRPLEEEDSLWGTKRVLRDIIHKGVEEGEIKSPLSESDIFEYLQTLCSGISKRFCITNGKSLPNSSLKSEIFRWIDSLYQ